MMNLYFSILYCFDILYHIAKVLFSLIIGGLRRFHRSLVLLTCHKKER